MFDQPRTAFSKSDLRKPSVVAHAQREPVEIRIGGSEESLVLLSQRLLRAHGEVERLTCVFLRMVVELRRPEPSPVMLGEVSYILNWTADEQNRFVNGLAEALAESLRIGDPAPAHGFIEIMANTPPVHARPDLTGDLSGLSDEQHDKLAARLSH